MKNLTDWEDLKKELFEKDKTLETTYQAIGKKVAFIDLVNEHLKANNMTQAELANQIGVSQQVISRFLRGKINPRFDFITKILVVISANIVFENSNFDYRIFEKQKFKIGCIPIRGTGKSFSFHIN